MLSDLVGKMHNGIRALVIEQRVPGTIYSGIFDYAHAWGIKEVIISKCGLDTRVLTSHFSIYYESFFKKVYDHKDYLFGPNQIVVDIGANLGFFSLYAAKAGASVIAVEPCVENLEFLEWNVAKNHLEGRITIVNGAVAASSGPIGLYVGFSDKGEAISGTASVVNENRGGARVDKRVVPGFCLEDLFNRYQVTHCDFLKIDCEGGDYAILEGASQSTFDRIRRISIETHSGRGKDAARILEGAGFRIISFEDGYTGMLKAVNARLGDG